MTDTLHTCSYYCDRPECIRAQRDELRLKQELRDTTVDILEQTRRELAEAHKLLGQCADAMKFSKYSEKTDWSQMIAAIDAAIRISHES